MAYNSQTAVDSETHLIRDFDMTNQVTDHGLLASTVKGICEETDGIIDVVADKGYTDTDDMIKCLEEGIVPHVIMPDGKDGYELEIAYEEAEDVHPESTAPEEVKKAIHAGIVPDIYKETIAEIEVAEGLRRVSDEPAEKTYPKSVYGMPEEMMERAREGYFVRDPERNKLPRIPEKRSITTKK